MQRSTSKHVGKFGRVLIFAFLKWSYLNLMHFVNESESREYMLTCAFFKILHNKVYIFFNYFIFKHLFALMLHRLLKETTFNKIREISGCKLEALMKNFHLFIPQFFLFLFDETWNKGKITVYIDWNAFSVSLSSGFNKIQIILISVIAAFMKGSCIFWFKK